MRKFAGIIESTVAPPTNCLWLDKGRLKANINGKWADITSTGGDIPEEDKMVIIDLSEDQANSFIMGQTVTIENNNLIGGVNTIKLRLPDNTFQILNNIYGFGNVFVYRGDISNSNDFSSGNTYTSSIIYADGFLNIDSGTFTFRIFNTDIPNDIIGLEIGNTVDVKSHNLALLNKYNLPYFFTQLDYGYGVGTFNSTNGGFIHIINAYGNDIFYEINADGSINKVDNYLKPNEPYSVNLEADQIGVELDNITASKINLCGELIVTGTTGTITYTRCSDSTPNSISFTDITKQGKLSILTYNAATKTISSATTNLYIPAASATTIGGVKKGPHVSMIIESAGTMDIAAQFNVLIEALIQAGVLPRDS